MTRLRLGKHETQGRLLPLKSMPRPISESKIKAQIMRALARLPYVLMVNTPSGKAQVNGGWIQLCPKGWPDISGIVQKTERIINMEMPFNTTHSWTVGVPFHLEVKTSVGKLHGDQQAMHDRIRSLGGFVKVVRSVAEAMDAVREAREK
jgi:hypothetical protein